MVIPPGGHKTHTRETLANAVALLAERGALEAGDLGSRVVPGLRGELFDETDSVELPRQPFRRVPQCLEPGVWNVGGRRRGAVRNGGTAGDRGANVASRGRYPGGPDPSAASRTSENPTRCGIRPSGRQPSRSPERPTLSRVGKADGGSGGSALRTRGRTVGPTGLGV